MISFRMDWLDLLAVQGTLKSLLQHHHSKASVLQRSAFFIAQLSHPYMTTGKTRFDYMDLCWQSNQANLTCLLRNLYTVQEGTVRMGHGTTNWFQIGKGVRQGCILSPCLFNSYAEYIMRNTGLDEAQAGIKISGRNINNLRYSYDTTLVKEELKSPMMTVKEESKKLA